MATHAVLQDPAVEVKVYMYEVEQFKDKITRLTVKPKEETAEAVTLKRTKEVETLMADSRQNVRRLKLQKTSDGHSC